MGVSWPGEEDLTGTQGHLALVSDPVLCPASLEEGGKG